MDKWRIFKGTNTRGWRVENGEMRALGQEGLSADIISIDTFSNFELSLEWNISQPANPVMRPAARTAPAGCFLGGTFGRFLGR